MLLPSDQLAELKNEIKCRNHQFDYLNACLWKDPLLCPPVLLLHGSPATGKSTVIEALLQKASVSHSIIQCDGCVTPRMLLQRTFRSISKQLGIDSVDDNNVTDNYSEFFQLLEDAMEDKPVHVLVLDRIDQFPESNSIPDVINCFTRHAEFSAVRNLVVVFSISSLQPRSLITTSVPRLYFPRYSQEEAIAVVKSLHSDKDSSLWNGFVEVVINGLSSYTGTDIRLIKDVASKVWPEYIEPVLKGSILPHEHQKLYKHSQSKFTSEWAVTNSLIANKDENSISTATGSNSARNGSDTRNYDLPESCKYLLCAAYLASYNPPKTDIRFFSKSKDIRISRKEIRDGANSKSTFSRRSLAAPSFDMERLLAILHSISENSIPHQQHNKITLQMHIATLTTLRLLIRTNSSDPLSLKTKWKVNVGWSMIQRIANDIGIDMKDYLYE